MRHDDRDEQRRRCGVCGTSLRPNDLISVADVGERCNRCFNEELADRLGIDFDNTPIAPIVVADADGARHRFEIRSLLVGTGHVMSAREVTNRGATSGYRFEILGDHEINAHALFTLLAERIRQGLSVRHVQQTEHGWHLTPAHRLSGVIEWDPDSEGALPLLIVDGRTFTWDQIGRMMTFEGCTLNAIVEDTIEVVGGPPADGRLGSQATSRSAPAVPAPVIRLGASNRQTAKRGRPTRSWPPSPRRLDALIEEATVDAYGESEQATAFLTVLEEYLALPCGATVLGETVVVEKIDLSGADELIAICRRRGKRQKVRLLDLELPVPRPKGAEWVAAYHRWARRR
jgi:hypothetical protein